MLLKLLPAALLILTGCSMTSPGPGSVKTILTESQQGSLSPAEVVVRLREGNDRFRSSNRSSFDFLAQARESASGQHPMAYVLSCVDSRVLPETIFDCGIGDLFVGRVAGNFENTDQLGSMEYAVKAVGTPLIVVLGHASCGAVKGACDHVNIAGNLTELLKNLAPAVEGAQTSGERNSKNKAFVASVVEGNVLRTMADIQQRSPTIRDLIASGSVGIAGGVYDLGTGTVRWLSVPQ